ncbi:MAG: ATP-binding protein [Nanoarchaeota archaeon]
MNINTKVVLGVGIAIIISSALLFAVLSLILLSNIDGLEAENARHNVQRGVADIKEELEALELTASDYAAWDMTYEFMETRTTNYTATEISDDTLFRLNVDFMGLFDAKGNTVYFRIPEGADPSAAKEEIALYFLPGKFFLSHEGADSTRSGIIKTGHNIMLVASKPIVHTTGEGPVVGSLVMGKVLGEKELDSLEERIVAGIKIIDLSQDLPEGIAELVTNQKGEFETHVLNGSSISGFTVIKDIDGKSSFVLFVYLPRSIHNLGVKALLYFLFTLIVLGLLLVLALLFILNKVILSRLFLIMGQLSEIAVKKNQAARIKIGGNDELAGMAAAINKTLDTVEKSSGEYEAILKSMPDAYFRISANCTILDFRDEHNVISDFLKPELGKKVCDGLPEEISARLKELVKKSIGSNEKCDFEFFLEPVNKHFEMRIARSSAEEVIAIFRDIGMLKKNELELKKRSQELEKARIATLNIMEDLTETNKHMKELDQAKTDFLNIASHELKTPLTAISAYIEILDDYKGSFTPDQQQGLDVIKRNSNQLKTIINNILEISRLDAGRFELNFTELKVEEALKRIIENLDILAVNKGLALKLQLKPMPTMITDTMRFDEIMNNLIGNAIKFTDKGSITITAEQDGSMASFQVIDTGSGIPEEKIPNLFQKFYQVDQTISRKFGGTGLGLSITKRMIELQNGSITITSKVGQGTTFAFKLPMQPIKKEVEK